MEMRKREEEGMAETETAMLIETTAALWCRPGMAAGRQSERAAG